MSTPPAFRLRSPDIMPPRRRKLSARSMSAYGKYQPPDPTRIQIFTAADVLRGARPISAEAQQLTLVELALQCTLWCAGDIDLLQRQAVAIVGTRNVTPEGAARARRLGKELAHAGVTVISGLAKGVDTAALTSAMDARGRVVAVIGTPIDRAYPAENRTLQETIHRDHLLISQFAPGRRVFPSNFPERNRMMALLSDASVIIEAGETSGTLHQAAECVRLGRWLFIAKNVVDDASLTWPAKFRSYANVRTLTSTRDVLAVLA